MSFEQRVLEAGFTLGQGTFGDSDNSNQSTAAGLRMCSQIKRAGGAGMAKLSLTIYGMKLSTMNTLSTLGVIATTYRKNIITLNAGNSDTTSTVFQGTITNAYVDLQSMPEAKFQVEASSAFINALAPADPSSYRGAVDVAQVLSGLAAQMGVPFENNGVSVILQSPYFYGSLRQQALAAVQAAGISWNGIEDGTLAIWMPGQARGGAAPLISEDTGLATYPKYTALGIRFQTVFNPSIGFGKQVNVQSSQVLKFAGQTGNAKVSANGVWNVVGLDHYLDSLMPHGKWFSDVQCAPPGYVVAPG